MLLILLVILVVQRGQNWKPKRVKQGRRNTAISGAYLDDDARAHLADSHLPASRGILIRTHPYVFIH